MASIPLSVGNFKALKKAVAEDLGNIPKSGHLDEAIAAALGYRTYAAFRADVISNVEGPIRLLSEPEFEKRLLLDYPEFREDPCWWIGFDSLELPALIQTVPLSAYDIEYKSRREKAWRSLIVSAVNSGVSQKMFGLRPGEDWNVADRSDAMNSTAATGYYEFLLFGEPVLALVEEAGFDELSIYVMLCPTKGSRRVIRHSEYGTFSGAAWARCWVERREGAWVQSSTGFFRCRHTHLHKLASLDVVPAGFGDRGSVHL